MTWLRILALLLAFSSLLLGCAPTPPVYLCEPAQRRTGEPVIVCTPFIGKVAR